MVTISTDESTDELVGRVLNDAYRIDSWIASGGMGAVYRGTQLAVERAVAIKMMHGSLSLDRPSKQRFFREARLLAELNHPNVIQLIDFGELDSGVPFLVTELLEGVTLSESTPAQCGVSVEQVVDWFSQICMAVQAAHRKKLIHRDLKPSNIFIQSDDTLPNRVKVLDFGIAKAIHGHSEDEQLTKTGTVVGTPAYISPEQLFDAGEPDPRSDVYSLGAILYFLVAGRAPYSGHSSQAIITKQLTEPPELIDFELLQKSPELWTVISKAMSMEAENRYDSPDALMAGLRATLETAPTHASFASSARNRDNDTLIAGAGGALGAASPTLISKSSIGASEISRGAQSMLGAPITSLFVKRWGGLILLVVVAVAGLFWGPDGGVQDPASGQAISKQSVENEARTSKSKEVTTGEPRVGLAEVVSENEAESSGRLAPALQKPVEAKEDKKERLDTGTKKVTAAGLSEKEPKAIKTAKDLGERARSCAKGLTPVVKENGFYCMNPSGQKEGTEIAWRADQSKRFERSFRNGVLEGRWKEWFANGQERGEGAWRKGKKDGQWQSWSSTGQLSFQGSYRDGVKEGLWSAWHQNGQLKRRGRFVSGKEEGIWSSWYANGQLKTKGALKRGQKEGLWKSWTPEGELVREVEYLQGKVTK